MTWVEIITELENRQAVCAFWTSLLTGEQGEIDVEIRRNGKTAFITDSNTDLEALRDGLRHFDNYLHVRLEDARRQAKTDAALVARKAKS